MLFDVKEKVFGDKKIKKIKFKKKFVGCKKKGTNLSHKKLRKMLVKYFQVNDMKQTKQTILNKLCEIFPIEFKELLKNYSLSDQCATKVVAVKILEKHFIILETFLREMKKDEYFKKQSEEIVNHCEDINKKCDSIKKGLKEKWKEENVKFTYKQENEEIKKEFEKRVPFYYISDLVKVREVNIKRHVDKILEETLNNEANKFRTKAQKCKKIKKKYSDLARKFEKIASYIFYALGEGFLAILKNLIKNKT